ncbi:MAG: Flp pilus assembly complex ATPase component TadA [Christensenellaceae bacterium]|nr:Flp pilus assembly complex ATPase component TadA [Christensenellaceae bacterium]
MEQGIKILQSLIEILPDKIKVIFERLPLGKIYELRLRANTGLVVNVAGKNIFYQDCEISRIDIDNIIHKAGNYAIYSVNEQIKHGFITIGGGIRMGIAGEIVQSFDNVVTIKNAQALCIRIPHEVNGCSFNSLPYVFETSRPKNMLLVAPPGAGKTTFLRDLAVRVCESFPNLNVLILDERGEIAGSHLGDNQLFVGDNTDVITGGSKSYGFENGIRSLRPDVIITDEIATLEDMKMIETAVRSGVTVFASVHANDINDIRKKPSFDKIIEEKVFDRFVVLETKDHAGQIAGIYNAEFKAVDGGRF